MVSNTLFSILFALCALVFAVTASDHGHAAAHLAARDVYGAYTTSTSTLSSTSTVYKTVTIKKTNKYYSSHTVISASGYGATHHNGTAAAPYNFHNSTTYAHATGTGVVYVSSSPAPATANPTAASTSSTVSSNDAGRIGAWGGAVAFVALVCASLS